MMPMPPDPTHLPFHASRCRALRVVLAAIVPLLAASAGAQTALRAVPEVPGAFEPEAKTAPVMVQGKPLDAAKVESLAGKGDGFDVLDSGWALMGTTDPRGVFLLDLRDPRQMKVVRPLIAPYDWLSLITPRYLAAWQGRKEAKDSSRQPRVFDLSKLPDELHEVTALVPQLPQLRVLTVPRPSQVPRGKVAWR